MMPSPSAPQAAAGSSGWPMAAATSSSWPVYADEHERGPPGERDRPRRVREQGRHRRVDAVEGAPGRRPARVTDQPTEREPADECRRTDAGPVDEGRSDRDRDDGDHGDDRREVERVGQPQGRGARAEQDDRDDPLDEDDGGAGRVVDAVLRPEQVEPDQLAGRARRDVVDGVREGGHRDERPDRHGTAGPGQQVRRAGRPGDDDHEVEQDRGDDRSRVGVAELLAELPRPRTPGDEREQRDRDRAPDERVAEESGHGSRCQTTASSVVVATDQPAGGPGSATNPVTDWTVIGSIASMRSGAPAGQVDRGLDDREVGAQFGRRRQVDGGVAGVEPEARSGRPGDRRSVSGAGSRGRSGP